MAVVELDNLVKDYGQVRAIHGVDLRIEDGLHRPRHFWVSDEVFGRCLLGHRQQGHHEIQRPLALRVPVMVMYEILDNHHGTTRGLDDRPHRPAHERQNDR